MDIPHSTHRRIRRGLRLAGVFIVVGAAGCGEHRPAVSEAKLLAREQAYNQRVETEQREGIERLLVRLNREFEESSNAGSDQAPTVDVLILSGGGEYGSFGAGFLQGWGTVKDPLHARPDFDVVTGVSTGALIAPFAFVGADWSYERIVSLYENPKRDWAVVRPLFFFPSNPSIVSIDGLEQELREQVDERLVRAIAERAEEGRLLCVASTNLDYCEQRIFDLGAEVMEAARNGKLHRVHEILLASSAIPGVFPPRIIDGVLYVDGGVTANILYNPDMRSPSSGMAMWRREYPSRPIPRQRIWVIINEQVQPPPQVVSPKWVEVAGASLDEIVRSGTYTALRQLVCEAALARARDGSDIEVRYVSIPNDWRDTGSGMFDRKTMDGLAKLGMKMGADPASWKTVDGDDTADGSIQNAIQ